MNSPNSIRLKLVPKGYREIKIKGIPASNYMKRLLQFNITTTATAVVMIVIAAIMLHDPNAVIHTLGVISVGHCFLVGIPKIGQFSIFTMVKIYAFKVLKEPLTRAKVLISNFIGLIIGGSNHFKRSWVKSHSVVVFMTIMAIIGGLVMVIINLSRLHLIPEYIQSRDGAQLVNIRSMKIGTEIINIMSMCAYVSYAMIFCQILKVYRKLYIYYSRHQIAKLPRLQAV
ncbi:hypothetical protein TrispH2_009450 [Trichoplax sp. H2]|nr:hypothetical protein TrispH2_009450 [Trichoplax sp. H2]|eukprot:RDD38856.1 hypothetical protein TrispH2_009450 [Trichoplax sp. H2]